MIRPYDAYHSFITLFGVWTAFFFIRFQIFNKVLRGFTNIHLTFRKFKVIWNRRLHKPQRLCGYHIGDSLRPGMLALLDSDNCEECSLEKKAK